MLFWHWGHSREVNKHWQKSLPPVDLSDMQGETSEDPSSKEDTSHEGNWGELMKIGADQGNHME